MHTTRATSRKDSLASLRRKALPLSLSLLLCGALASAPAMAGTVGATTTPTGGSIIGGSGSILQDGASVVVNQASNKLVLNWQSFNLGQDASVRFNQPGASAVALNRILDQNPSQIFGQISSNGQVFLINTHGIIFGTTAQVNVGGLVASTLDLTPTDFLSNHFNLNAVGGSAGIVNHGTIAAAIGGSVSLVGGKVENDGVIVANYGRINLDGADHAVLDFDGNGLINVQITGALQQRLDADEAAVANKGTLQADGGTVVLQASAAKDLFTNLVNNEGVIDAHGISTDGGVVRLVGSGGNTVSNGDINVSGRHGGSVQLLSDRDVAVGGSVDASGAFGGGSIRAGGGARGGEGLLQAANTTVEAGASLNADATQSGDGGSIAVWSSQASDIAGNFSARGGALGGDGGGIETSGERIHIVDGTSVNTLAPHGQSGDWLIDPQDFTIAATGGDITGTLLNSNLATGNVTILSSNGGTAGTGNINVNAPVSWNSHVLTLTAANNIVIGGTGSLAASGTAGLTLNPATTNANTAGTITDTAVVGGTTIINSGGSMSLAGSGAMSIGNVTDNGALTFGLSGNLSYGGTVSGSASLTQSGTGTLTLTGTNTYSGGTTVSAGTLAVAADNNLGTATGGITLNGGTLQNTASFITTRAIALGASGGTLQTDAALTASGVISGASGSLAKTGTGTLTLGGANTYSGGTTISAGTLSVATDGNLGAASAGLTFNGGTLANSAAISSARNVALLAGGGTVQTGADLSLTGVVSGSGQLTKTGSGKLTLSNTNTYGGGTQVDTGTLAISSDTNLGAAAGGLTLNGGTLENTASLTLNRTLALGASGGTLQTDASTNLATTGAVSGTGSLTQTSTGSLTLGGNVTTGGSQTYNGAVLLGNDVTLTSSTGSVNFAGTVDNAGATARALSANAASGTVVFGGALGGGANGRLASLTTSSQTFSANALAVAGNLSVTTTAGAIGQGGAFQVGGQSSFHAGSQAITLGNASNAFTGMVDLTGGVAQISSGSPLTLGTVSASSLAATGNTITLVGNITTSGAQTYSSAVALGADATLTSTGSGAIGFSGTVDGAHSLAVNTGGVTSFGGAVGGTTALTSLATDAGGSTTLNGNVTTSGAQTYGDAVGLGANTTLASSGSGAIGLNGSVDGAYSLAVNTGGATTFGGAVGGSTALASLATDAGGSTTLGGNVSTSGAQTYGDAVTLGANTTLASSGSGAISLNGTVDGAHSLVVNTAGATTFGGTIGGTTALASLTTDAAGSTVLGANTKTTGAQSYNDAVTLGGDVALASTGNGAIGFTSTVNGAHALTVNTAGTTTFGGALGGTAALTSLTTDAAGGTTLGANVTTAGAQTYNDAMTLNTDVMLASTGNGAVGFASTVNGAHALTVNTGGVTRFGGAVGGTTALTSLTTDAAGSAALGASVTTAGAQTYNDAVTLNTDVTLTSTGNGAIGFASTVNGAHALTVNTGGAATFGGAVGGTAMLSGLAATSGTFGANALNINGNLSVATTAGGITQGGAFGVTGTSDFHAGGNAITLNNAGNSFGGAVGLFNTGANNVSLANMGLLTLGNGAVGSGTLWLSGTGIVQAAGSSITEQTGAGAVTLNAGTGTLTLANNGNALTGAVTASGNGISIASIGNLGIASLTDGTNGAVSLVAGGTLTLPATAIDTGTGNLTLSSNGGTLSASAALSGANVSLSGYSGLVLGGNVGTGATGTLTLNSGNGAISQTAGVLTATTLTGSSTGATALGGANMVGALGAFTANGFSLTNAQALTIAGAVNSGSGAAAINAGSNPLTVSGSVASNGNALTLGGGSLAVNGAVNAGAGTATLSSTGTTSEGVGGVITAGTLTGSSTGATTLTGANQVGTLGAFGANGFSLSNAQALTVGSGAVVSGGAGGTTLQTTVGGLAINGTLGDAGATTVLSSAGTITEGVAGVVKASTLSGSAAGDATLAGANLIGTLGSFSAANFTLADAQGLTLAGPLGTTGNVDVSTSTGPLAVATGVNAGGNDIRLAASAGSLTVSGNLSGRDVTLVGLDGLSVAVGAGVSASRSLGLTSTGAPIAGSGTFTIGGASTVQAGTGTITLDNGANHFGGSVALAGGATRIVDSGALTLGTLATGDLTVTSHGPLNLGSGSVGGNLIAASNGGPISQATGGLAVTGASQFTAGTGTVTLTDPGNLLTGAVTVQGGSIALRTGADLTVASVSSGGSVNLVAGGALHLPAATIDVGTGDLTLAANGGSLSTVGALKGNNVSLSGRDGLTLGNDVTAGGALSLASSNAAIAQTAGKLAVTGTSTVNAGTGSIALAGASNDFTGAVNLTGGAAQITDANALALGTLATGNLIASSSGSLDLGKGAVSGLLQATSNGGAISQDTGGLAVTSTSTLNAGSGAITLADGNNDFIGPVNLTGGTVSISDKNALVLGALATGALTAASTGPLDLGSGTVGGNLAATSNGGAISQGGALSVAGTSNLNAGTGGITLTNAGNQFGGAVSLAGAATQIAGGSNLTLGTLATGDLTANSSGALNLGSGSVGGILTATSNGAIGQTGGLAVAGSSTLNAGSGAIALTNAANDFQASVNLAGNGVAVNDANSLAIGTLSNAPNSAVSLTAGGVLTLPATAIQTGSADLALASNGGTLATQAALGGANVSLGGRDGVSLAHDVSATGMLALASTAGTITQAAGALTAGTLTGHAGGSVTLGGANAIGQLGSFSANGFSLATSGALAVSGPVDGGTGSTSLHSGGALAVAGDIRGSGVALRGDGGIGQSSGSIDAGNGQVSLQSGTGIAQTGGSITAGTLTGSAANDASLAGGNHLGVLGSFSAANLALGNAQGLTLAGPVSATGNAALTIGGNLAINGTLGANSTSLNVNGAITEGASGNLVTGTLGGQASGDVGLTGNNHVGALGSFNAANFTLVNGQALAVNGSPGVGTTGSIALSTTAGALDVNAALSGGQVLLDTAGDLLLGRAVQGQTVSLASGGSISQAATGLITAGTLSGHSIGNTTLDQANAIGALGNFTANGLTLASTQALDVGGAVNGGARTSLASGGDLHIDGTVQGDATALSAQGTISEGTGGMLVANALTGQATGAVTLEGANHIASLGQFQSAGFSLRDAQDLTVAGALDGGTSTMLTTAGNLAIGGVVKGTATQLDVGGALSETATGSIVADTLGGRITGAANLTGANAVARLGDFGAAGFNFNNGQALSVDGVVDGGASTTLVTAAGGLTVAGSLSGTSTTLDVADSIDQTTHGRITAGTLSGKAGGDVVLDGDNRIGALGSFQARDFMLANGQALAVNGPLTASGGVISLATTAGKLSVNTDLSGGSITLASADDLALGHAVHGGMVSLQSGGSISQAAGSLITADSLAGHSAGSTVLDQANAITALGDFSANGLSIATGGGLAVNGLVNGGGSTTLTTGGDLALAGTLTGDTTMLAVNGAISEAGAGSITAHTLAGHAAGPVSLGGANRIDTLGAFTAAGFALSNGPSLAVNGPLDGGASVSLATTRGDLAINGKIVGRTTMLASSGAIAEGQGGSIVADTLTGRAGGRTQLGTAASPLANYIGTLGGFASPAGFSLTNAQTLTLASVGGSGYTLDAGTSPVYLGVSGGDLLQLGTTPLFDGQGTFAATGRIGTSDLPIRVTGTGPQAVAIVGAPPAYFYAVNRSGNLLPLTGGSSVNVPTSLFTSRAQNANNHTDTYIDPSVISANYRSFGIVPSGILLPADQQACDPQQEECDE